MIKETINKLKEIYSLNLIEDPERAYDISKWIAGEMCEEGGRIERDSSLIIDTPEWSAEVIECNIKDYYGIFVSIRYKNETYRDMTCFHKDEATPENIQNFLESDRMPEILERKRQLQSPKRFDGDIVITDPCYIMSGEEKEFEEHFGPTYIYGPTIYGDWSCTTFDLGSRDPMKYLENPTPGLPPIGEFCADAGMVCVVYLNKIPKESLETLRDWTRTIIKDFHGEVTYTVVSGSVHIIGRSDNGIHNFVTLQTGL